MGEIRLHYSGAIRNGNTTAWIQDYIKCEHIKENKNVKTYLVNYKLVALLQLRQTQQIHKSRLEPKLTAIRILAKLND